MPWPIEVYSREPEPPILTLRLEDVNQFLGHSIANDRDNNMEKIDKSDGITRDNTGPLYNPSCKFSTKCDYAGICQIRILPPPS